MTVLIFTVLLICVSPCTWVAKARVTTYRVSPACGFRNDRNAVRVTAVTTDQPVSTAGAWDHQGPFEVRWPNFYSGTKVTKAGEGEMYVGNADSLNINVPPPKAGVRALVVGDPCFFDWCPGGRWGVGTKLPALINAIAKDIDLFIILGDNFYDHRYTGVQDFFGRFSLEAQAKLLVTTPGNHDMWIEDHRDLKRDDNFGYAFMQYFGQDVLAAKYSGSKGYDFSQDQGWASVAKWTNFFHYSAVGNLGLISFSGMHSYAEQRGGFEEACQFMTKLRPQLILLLTHFDGYNRGAKLIAQDAFKEVYYGPCAAVKDRLRYMMGHTHENYPMSDGNGFLLGGAGMRSGANEWGISIVDTNNERNKLTHFVVAKGSADYYDQLMGCIRSSGGIQNCAGKVFEDSAGTNDGPGEDPDTPPKTSTPSPIESEPAAPEPVSPAPVTPEPVTPKPISPVPEAACNSRWRWRYYDGIDIAGADIANERQPNRIECEKRCHKFSGCRSYSFAYGVCYYKWFSSGTSLMTPNPKVFSAVRC